MIRTCVLSMVVSVDGYINGPGGERVLQQLVRGRAQNLFSITMTILNPYNLIRKITTRQCR